jgi:glucan phosphorylase
VDDLKDEFPHLPERIAKLGELAYNLWWSWHPAARMLFKRLDRLAWKASGHNPVKLLKVLPQKSLDAAASDPEYLGQYTEANQDAPDAEAIYAILEQQAVPLYYQVNDEGIPVEWVKMMRAAMKSSGPFFSARRMIKEYSRKFYQPALQSLAN